MKINPFVLALVMLLLVSSLASAGGLSLASPDLKPGGRMPEEQVFSGFGCTGGNRSPALSWDGVPKGSKSLAVTLYDPDAPTGSGWWHWLIFNIDPKIKGLQKGAGDPKQQSAPKGSIQSRTDFGQAGYGGACPPTGDKPHRYHFTLWALKTERIPLDKEASGAMLGFYLNQNVIEKETLTVFYSR